LYAGSWHTYEQAVYRFVAEHGVAEQTASVAPDVGDGWQQ